jgi:hypothetical protein
MRTVARMNDRAHETKRRATKSKTFSWNDRDEAMLRSLRTQVATVHGIIPSERDTVSLAIRAGARQSRSTRPGAAGGMSRSVRHAGLEQAEEAVHYGCRRPSRPPPYRARGGARCGSRRRRPGDGESAAGRAAATPGAGRGGDAPCLVLDPDDRAGVVLPVRPAWREILGDKDGDQGRPGR